MSLARKTTAALFIGASLLSAPRAQSAEVEFEGYYRNNLSAFQNLTLDNSLATTEGTLFAPNHRLWLKPRFVLNEHVALFVEFRGLDGVPWGRDTLSFTDPTTGAIAPPALEDSVGAPYTSNSSNGSLSAGTRGFNLWRGWAEVQTDYGRFRFGRMPLQWGQGLWQNDGISNDKGLMQYGDTADRVEWEFLADDQLYLQVAYDLNAQGLINQSDDLHSFNLSVAYKTEQFAGGVRGQYRVQKSPGVGTSLTLGTISTTAEVDLGAIQVGYEGVGQFGSGDLGEGASNVRIMGFGAVLNATLETELISVNATVGLATGDKSPNDETIRAFHFDRDYNIGLMMFEQPMPVLASGGSGTGRNFDEALSANGVSNALFGKVEVSKEIVPHWRAKASFLTAKVAALPDTLPVDELGRKNYGMEFLVGFEADLFDYLRVDARGGLFLPGTWYSGYNNSQFNFSQPAFGGLLTTSVRF